MKFNKTGIKNVYKIKRYIYSDERGDFSRIFCKKIFSKYSKKNLSVQTNICINKKKFTFRGFHFQEKPYHEDKIITCINGEALDFVVDFRKKSKTYLKVLKFKISKKNGISIFVPRGCAHGYLTLTNHCVVIYNVSNFYNKKKSKGIRFNDPTLNINWKIKPKIISEQDKSWPLLEKKKY
tara:strand:- start:198 stop:737 length:540 start_codon:yes stop_codon:yes gene_type:complete